jgi:hypothetical protein
MSTNTLKLIAGAAAAVFILILIGVLSIFAFYGKTSIEPVVYQIGILITSALSLVMALAGHVAGAAGKPQVVYAAPPPAAPVAAPTTIVSQ